MRIDKRILLIRTIGNTLILGTIVAIGFTFWPIGSAFVTHTIDNFSGKKFEASATTSSGQTFGSLLGKEDPNIKVLVPKDPNFSIIVEKIGADAPIIPNVDASNKAAYTDALKRGVAHALGTSFPGEAGVTYLFAHSTDTIFNVPRFNAIFYLLNDLVPGDRVVIFFNNKRFDYAVTEKKITEPADVSYFTLKTSEQILVMQTCYPPGTTWKRLLVVAKPVGI
jgi:sortase A